MYSLLKVLGASALCAALTQAAVASELEIDPAKAEVARLIQKPLAEEAPEAIPTPEDNIVEGEERQEEVKQQAESDQASNQPEEEAQGPEVVEGADGEVNVVEEQGEPREEEAQPEAPHSEQ
ncbi:hypothetical protein Efla_006801 [Eimeria flavescens]